MRGASSVDEWLWVLIETGSNQDFIFQSNRQRFQVGASGILRSVPEWVGAVADPDEVVVCTSSKAVLRVAERDRAQHIVEAVTRKALLEAPGLDIWGFVEDEADRSLEFQGRMAALHHGHARTRRERVSARLRYPIHPFSEICAQTGLPASDVAQKPGGDGRGAPGLGSTEPASPVALAAAAAAIKIRDDLDAVSEGVLRDRREEIDNSGWVAVVHADGNRVGEALQQIDTVEQLREFSKELENATSVAFNQACTIPEVEGRQNWLLPLIIGGDDVTFVCDAAVAIPVVRAYLTAFEELSAGLGTIGREKHLTAAAGIGVVKPHYPFHAAYELAEELARNAKQVREVAPDRSAYDFHVLHDSVARGVHDIRAEMQASGASWLPWPRLFLAPPGDGSEPSGPWEDRHLIEGAADLLVSRDEAPLSGSGVHDLRAAVLDGDGSVQRTTARLRAGSRNPGKLDEFLSRHLQVPTESDESGGEFSRLLCVIDLVDITQGVSAGGRAKPRRHEEGRV
jgi:hypothetical protein